MSSEQVLSFTPGAVEDDNNDLNLDSGVDYYFAAANTYSGYTVEINGNDYAIFQEATDSSVFYIPYAEAFDQLANFVPIATKSTSTQNENGTAQNFCFATGTPIATPHGNRAVETLGIGDLVSTADGRAVPVRWIGRQEVRPGAVNLPLPTERLPIRIEAGALGDHGTLVLSADHGLVLEGCVINAGALVNGTTIRYATPAEMGASFTYWHIETEAHDVILAAGLPAETFIDAVGRAAFDNHADYLALYGAERIVPEMRLPRVTSARLLPPTLRQRLGLTDEHAA